MPHHQARCLQTLDAFVITEMPHTLDAYGAKVYGRPVVETYAGELTFNTEDVCWYLDSAFCSQFHALKARPPARTLL